MSIALTFPDSTYSSSNKPSSATLKTDLQTIETDYNAHVADATIHFLASTVWPIGSVYIAVVSTNPATLLGFGTWSAFAAGRTLVGLDAGQTEFDTVEETGGAKTHTLTVGEIPSHDHDLRIAGGGGAGTRYVDIQEDTTPSLDTSIVQPAGGGGAHNNLQPYIVTYMWKRTA